VVAQQPPKAPNAFIEELERALQLIASEPGIAPMLAT
jgi:hypothetical protein